MPLVDVELTIDKAPIPGDVLRFLQDAEQRIELFQRQSPVPGFVPSDFEGAFRVLRSLAATVLVPGTLFCEWGSGFGVVACLAAWLDFDAYGIEIEEELVSAARRLAADYELPVEFIRGSFIPTAALARLPSESSFAWLSTRESSAEDELGLSTSDFSVIFAYPWPDEEEMTEALFAKYAKLGAVLVTHHTCEGFRVRRKTWGKKRGRRPKPLP
jgi:hypothetical protein